MYNSRKKLLSILDIVAETNWHICQLAKTNTANTLTIWLTW